MNNLKKIILLLTILLVIMLTILIISINNSKKNIQGDYWTENGSEDYELNVIVKENTRKYDFFAVKNCIENYYSYIGRINITLQDFMKGVKGDYVEDKDYQKELEKNKETYKQAVYNCLGKEFLEEWNINTYYIEQKI